MANTPKAPADLAPLEATIADLHSYTTGDLPDDDLEPEHFTTCGYDHVIDAVAAAIQTATSAGRTRFHRRRLAR